MRITNKEYYEKKKTPHMRLLICNRVNNKKVGARCRCHITFCVQNQYLWISKFPIFRNILIHLNRFYLFLKCGILRNLFSFTQRKVCFLLCRLFIKKQYYDRYYDIQQSVANNPTRTRNHSLFLGLSTVSLGRD